MSKVKSLEIPHYELLYIISNKFSEDELEPIKEKINKAIANNEGVITFSEYWGKKRFAYPIGQYRQGYYSLIEFDLNAEKIAKIDRTLRMSSEILRHLIINKKKKTAEEIEQDKKIAEKIAEKRKEEEKKQERADSEEERKNKDELKMKDLDEKLDEILKADDLL